MIDLNPVCFLVSHEAAVLRLVTIFKLGANRLIQELILLFVVKGFKSQAYYVRSREPFNITIEWDEQIQKVIGEDFIGFLLVN